MFKKVLQIMHERARNKSYFETDILTRVTPFIKARLRTR